MLPLDLRWFKASEFNHPDLVDHEAAYFLDDVRHHCGFPLHVTDDVRVLGETRSGSSPTSLHYAGRAFDLKWLSPSVKLAKFVEGVVKVAHARGVTYELELVNSKLDQHIHLAVQQPGVPSEVIVAAD